MTLSRHLGLFLSGKGKCFCRDRMSNSGIVESDIGGPLGTTTPFLHGSTAIQVRDHSRASQVSYCQKSEKTVHLFLLYVLLILSVPHFCSYYLLLYIKLLSTIICNLFSVFFSLSVVTCCNMLYYASMYVPQMACFCVFFICVPFIQLCWLQ